MTTTKITPEFVEEVKRVTAEVMTFLEIDFENDIMYETTQFNVDVSVEKDYGTCTIVKVAPRDKLKQTITSSLAPYCPV